MTSQGGGDCRWGRAPLCPGLPRDKTGAGPGSRLQSALPSPAGLGAPRLRAARDRPHHAGAPPAPRPSLTSAAGARKTSPARVRPSRLSRARRSEDQRSDAAGVPGLPHSPPRRGRCDRPKTPTHPGLPGLPSFPCSWPLPGTLGRPQHALSRAAPPSPWTPPVPPAPSHHGCSDR